MKSSIRNSLKRMNCTRSATFCLRTKTRSPSIGGATTRDPTKSLTKKKRRVFPSWSLLTLTSSSKKLLSFPKILWLKSPRLPLWLKTRWVERRKRWKCRSWRSGKTPNTEKCKFLLTCSYYDMLKNKRKPFHIKKTDFVKYIDENLITECNDAERVTYFDRKSQEGSKSPKSS